MSIVDSQLLYEIYLAYKDNKIKETNPNEKDKYIATAAAEGYEPAIIVQARNFTENGDNYRALMLWQTLLYSSDPKVSELAKKEIKNVEKLVKKQRQAEIKKEKKAKLEEEKKLQQQIENQAKREEEIAAKKKVGLSVPKKEIDHLDGLIYINLFNVNKIALQEFYKNILDIEIDTDFLDDPKKIELSYIDNLMRLSKLKYNRSSLKFDFGENISTNKYEGVIYYFYNEVDKFTQDTLNSIISNIKPKKSIFEPKLQKFSSIEDPQVQVENIEKKEQEEEINKKDKEEPQNPKEDRVQLTHQEEIQRMQVFAQKGDFREFYKLEQAAKHGDVYAMYYVGIYYYKNKEYDNAMEYFNKAANHGYGPAYYKLATIYYNEEKNGVPYDKEKAMHYYKKAADSGVRNAKHILMLIR